MEAEHPPSFATTRLEEGITVGLGENIAAMTEILNEVSASVGASRISINHVCETADDSPHTNTVSGYFTDQFELQSITSEGSGPRPVATESLPLVLG
jgi:hypothetical protein